MKSSPIVINLLGADAPLPALANDISFRRLIEQLRMAGEFKPNETVTHLEIYPEDGFIRYRIREAA